MTETPEMRSSIMRAVKSADTTPELLVRRLTQRMGYRFRLHRKDLPGTPDLVFPSLRKTIFVNGCFWHGHDCPRGARVPKANRDYWVKKIARNQRRDEVTHSELTRLGWKIKVLWECELTNVSHVRRRLRCFLGQRPIRTGRKLELR